MGIKFFCKHCQQLLNIKTRYAGKDGSCPHCDKDIHVPTKSTIRLNQKFREAKNKSDSPKPAPILPDEDQKTVASFGETEEFDRNIIPASPAAKQGKPLDSLDSSSGIKKARAAPQPLSSSQILKQPKSIATKPTGSKPTVTSKDSNFMSSKPDVPPTTGSAESGSFLLDKPSNPWLEANAPDPLQTGLKKVWYVRHPKDGEIGPIQGKKVRKMLEDQEITPACYVWREDWEDWLRADVVFRRLEVGTGTKTAGDRVFTDPNCPIPKSYLKIATADERQKKRQQILIVVAVVVGIVTISLLAWLLATLL